VSPSEEVYEAAVALAAAARTGRAEAFVDGGYADLGGVEGLRGAAALIFAAGRAGDSAPAALVLDDAAAGVVARLFRRDDALAALYEAEQLDRAPDAGTLTGPASELASGVWAERPDLDAAIGEAATGWRIDRMTIVDRTVLRLGLYELRHHRSTPVAVVISEAVRLAKAYSTEHSGRFVNGVLARLADEERPGG